MELAKMVIDWWESEGQYVDWSKVPPFIEAAKECQYLLETDEALTVEMLRYMKPFTVFKRGYVTMYGEKCKWVAVRGGIHDWAIYYAPVIKDWPFVRSQGQKITSKDISLELVLCDEEAKRMYRN